MGLKHDLPVLFGVLTTDPIDQALERAGAGSGNKGFDIAIAALQMISLLDRLSDRLPALCTSIPEDGARLQGCRR